MTPFSEVWQTTLSQIKQSVSEVNFTSWFGHITPLSLEENRALIFVNFTHQKEKLEGQFRALIEGYMSDILGFDVFLEVTLDEDQLRYFKNKTEAGSAASIHISEYTFDTFIVGPSNNFAYVAAQTIADKPGTIYNPLFLHGGSGLGKTHLLYAISNTIKAKHPEYNILNLRTEEFVNELVEAIRLKKDTSDFRHKYRHADVLLVDDIQFIAGKEFCQEEFFNTFNTLYAENKQIVLTSDRPPRNIATLEERLRTRFESGLMADVQPPNLETRIAIVRQKSNHFSIDIPDNIIQFLAEKLKNNIRQLEGAVKKLKAICLLNNKPMTLSTAEEAIIDILDNETPISTIIQNIIDEVCRFYEISEEDIRGKRRTTTIAKARQIAMYIIQSEVEISTVSIGREFGGRDHSTVIHSINRIESAVRTDSSVRNIIDDLRRNLHTNI
jgi:chromosomal replication initiator protein